MEKVRESMTGRKKNGSSQEDTVGTPRKLFWN